MDETCAGKRLLQMEFAAEVVSDPASVDHDPFV